MKLRLKNIIEEDIASRENIKCPFCSSEDAQKLTMVSGETFVVCTNECCKSYQKGFDYDLESIVISQQNNADLVKTMREILMSLKPSQQVEKLLRASAHLENPNVYRKHI